MSRVVGKHRVENKVQNENNEEGDGRIEGVEKEA